MGYGYLVTAVPQFLDAHGYRSFYEVVNIYQNILLETEPERPLEKWFPMIPDADIDSVRPALEYAYSRLNEDPLRNISYPGLD